MLKFTLNKKQFEALEGLAYWIANETYTRQRFPEDVHEIKKCHDTICFCIFPELDSLGVPFWVQNSVVSFGYNLGAYRTTDILTYLKTRNIFMEV